MKKNAVICNADASPIMLKAVGELSEILLDYTYEYPICVKSADKIDKENFRLIFIGTKENNPYIAQSGIEIPQKPEGYAIRVKGETVIIAGFDDAGVLYGCLDFYNQDLVGLEFPDDDRYRINAFEQELPDFEYSSAPAVKNRGIWTWGHVIYDYRNFIDNMVKLKLNTLIVWNDFVPVNAKDMVEYAHSCGVKIIWGYAWGWDTDCEQFLDGKAGVSSQAIFERYEREYASLGGDGIYFQSFTELNSQEIGGKLIAQAVTEFVNETAAIFFEKYPDLELQFGLHATSVNKNLEFIKNVNPKIRIVWENCGAFPFSYIPSDVKGFDETTEFVRKIAVLRGNDDRFGAVTKGLTKLDWSAFEHLQGAAYSGVSSKSMKRNRVERKRKIWKYLQAYWLVHADKAYEAVRQMAEIKGGDLYITPLIEDGMFEENIMYPAALFCEMLWDCTSELDELMSSVALRDYVDFA